MARLAALRHTLSLPHARSCPPPWLLARRFAGLDASRALAKMSFEEADVHSRALGDLSPDQLKVMHDWAAKFEHQKLYPVVGTLEPFGA